CLKVGSSLKFKLTALPGDQLRLDAAAEITELTDATREELRVQGRSARLVCKVRPGKTVSLVLTRDEIGEGRSWVELTVREVKVEEENEARQGAESAPCRGREAIYPGNLPPIPR